MFREGKKQGIKGNREPIETRDKG